MEGALEELPGVRAARVDLKHKRVRVTYQSGAIKPEAMQRAMERVDVRLQTRHRLHRLIGWLIGRRQA